jgi:hypothetical protein
MRRPFERSREKTIDKQKLSSDKINNYEHKKRDKYQCFHKIETFQYENAFWTKAEKYMYNDIFKSKYETDCYIDFVKALYNSNNKFDYIILVAKKACILFRTVLRIAKAQKGYLPKYEDMPIVINTRTMCSYTFLESKKERKDISVLIFDDILSKGRNVERIVSNLNLYGIRNISYTALGINSLAINITNEGDIDELDIEDINLTDEELKLLKDNAISNFNNKMSLIRPVGSVRKNSPIDKRPAYLKEDYIVEFNNKVDRIILKETEMGTQEHLKINYYIPDKFKDGYFHNPLFVMGREQLMWLAQRINYLAHFFLIPYTGYLPYAIFSYDKSENVILKKFLEEDETLIDMPASVCNKTGVIMKMRPLASECCSKNGAFVGIRIMFNSFTKESVIFPTVMLPTLTVDQIKNIYGILFSDVELFKREWEKDGETECSFDLDWTLGLDDGLFGNTFDNPDHFTHYKFKHLYECASRRIISILSIIYTYNWIKNDGEKTGITPEKVLTRFADSIRTLYKADLQDDYENLLMIKKSILKCVDNVNNNPDIFNFTNFEKYNQNSNFNFIDYIRNDNKEEEERLKQTLKVLNEIPNNTKKENHENFATIFRCFSQIACDFNNIDVTNKYRVYPIPTFVIITKIHENLYGKAEMTNENFIEYATALYTANEDARSSCVVYAERRFFCDGNKVPVDKNNFIISNYYQCGELSIKWVDDNLKGKYQLLSYLISAQILIKTFYEEEIKKEKISTFANDYSSLLAKYNFFIEPNIFIDLLTNYDLQFNSCGDTSINKIENKRNDRDITFDSLFQKEVRTLISKLIL